MNEEKTTVTRFQFRLNGIITPHLKVRPILIDGAGQFELVVCHDTLGEFSIEDGEDDLLDPALPRFILEARDASIPPIERRFLPNKGWRRISTKECFTLLEAAGVIDPQ